MVRLLGLSPGGLAGQKIWQPGVEVRDTCWVLASFFLSWVQSPTPEAYLLWPTGIASHSSYESVFYSGIEKGAGKQEGIQ